MPRPRSWSSRDPVEWETLDSVDGHYPRRRLGSIGNIPPADAEAACDAGNTGPAMAARLRRDGLRESRGDSRAHQVLAPTSAGSADRALERKIQQARRSARGSARRFATLAAGP